MVSKKMDNEKVEKANPLNDGLGDFESAEQSFFRAVENVERRVINFAENIVHDEVHILFGRGHAIHDDKTTRAAVVRHAPVCHL
jgi:hypothetical protein